MSKNTCYIFSRVLRTDMTTDCAKNKPLFSYYDGTKIAAAFTRDLLKTYLFDAEITPAYISIDSPAVYLSLQSPDSCASLAFSDEAVFALVSKVFGDNDIDFEPTELTPASRTILKNIAQTMSSALGDFVCGNIETAAPENFDINKALSFKISDRYVFWLCLPDSKTETKPENMPVELTAVMQQSPLLLNQMSNWKVGSLLPLGIEKNAEISILHGNKIVFKGIMGQKSRHIAVKITKKVS